jgi:hypothetical protein
VLEFAGERFGDALLPGGGHFVERRQKIVRSCIESPTLVDPF